MATRKYWNNYSQRARTNEQQLVDDLLNEQTEVLGHDLYYIYRESEDVPDILYGEDPLAYFSRAYPIHMYIVDVDNYRGDGEFLSKFGLEARQGANFIVTQKAWNRFVPQNLLIRPREGDLIWVPVFGKMFEIKFVDKDKNFYQLGRRDPYFWEIYTEMWKFSQNKVQTGVGEIDDTHFIDSYSIRLHMNATSSNNYTFSEMVFQGPTLNTATAKAQVKAWNGVSGNLDVIHITGIFQPNAVVKGATTNTQFTLLTYDPLETNLFYEISDNKQIQTEANTISNFSETNPWGTP